MVVDVGNTKSNVQVVPAWPPVGPCQGGRCCEEGAGLCAVDNVGQVRHPCSSQGRDCPICVMQASHTAAQL